MGISSPAKGYSGWVATDDILQQDTTVYQATTTGYVEILSGFILEDIAQGSKLRFHAQLKDDQAAAGSMACRLYIGGVVAVTLEESGNGYVLHYEDFNFEYQRTVPISIRVRKSVAGTGSVKNITFGGLRSPVIIS